MRIGRSTGRAHARRDVALAALLTAAVLAGGCGSGGSPAARKPDAGTDAPQVIQFAVGQPCAGPTQCTSGFCADGVCCATACSGLCLTCAAPGSTGTCMPAEVGTDPRNDCDDQGVESCGTDGACDGAGTCQLYPPGVTCQQAGCSGATLTFAGRCDGMGFCRSSPGQSCAPFSCGAQGQCSTSCTTSADCASGGPCVAGSCGLKPIGASCAADGDCNSGVCAQGACCSTACAGLCQSCNLSGSAGACTNVPAGQDPLGQCADSGAGGCGTDGFCDGAGRCELYASGTTCGTDSCSSGSETPGGRCDGVGDCVAGTPQSCAPYVCGTGGDCKTTCAGNADCATGYTCQGSICCTGAGCGGAALGATCTAATDCASGFCQQGVCCATSCTGTCQSCALAASAGTCTNVPAGQDPLAQCTDAGAASCATDGSCDGAGKCRLYAAGTTCAAATCSGSTATAARTCDGAGTCATATPSSCAPFACDTAGTACGTTCTTNAGCASPSACNTTTMSCGLASNGSACTAGTTCNSGFCAQGVCCATACTGTCSACNVTGSVGTCVAVPAGQDPLNQCADAGATSCGLNGLCNGSGACQKYAAGTSCGSVTCAGSTLTPAAACDGNGTCVTPATSACTPYVCGTNACKTSCTTSADCVSPAVCTANVCSTGCPGVYCDNFESDTVGAMATGWIREGGSDGDWQVITDASKAFAQNHAQSATFRLVYASGTPWSSATTISASAKVLASGSSGTTTALVCLRYSGGSSGDYVCLALEPGVGAQIKLRNSGSVTSGPQWTPTIAVGTTYTVTLSASATGALSATLNGTALGSYTPTTALASGFIALATQSAEAVFDNIVVTQP